MTCTSSFQDNCNFITRMLLRDAMNVMKAFLFVSFFNYMHV